MRDLVPRLKKGETTKSAWSYQEGARDALGPGDIAALVASTALGEAEALLREYAMPLHALALFVFKHLNVDLRRDWIGIVTFPRDCIAQELLNQSVGCHLVSCFDEAHVDIDVAQIEDRENTFRRICEGDVRALDYTRDELRPLYEILLARGLIRDCYRAVAQRAFESRSA